MSYIDLNAEFKLNELHSSERWIQIQVIVHFTSQHCTIWQPGRQLVRTSLWVDLHVVGTLRFISPDINPPSCHVVGTLRFISPDINPPSCPLLLVSRCGLAVRRYRLVSRRTSVRSASALLSLLFKKLWFMDTVL